MLHRARRVAPVSAAFAAALIVLVTAPAAPAATAADSPWPAGTKAVVQARQGTQIPEPGDSTDNGSALMLAHGYGYTPVVAGDATTGAQLKLRFWGHGLAEPGHAVTLMDFDRDGHPDVLVDAEMTDTHAATPTNAPRTAGIAYVYDVHATADIDRCAAVPARSSALFSVATIGYEVDKDLLFSVVPLGKLGQGASPIDAGLLKTSPAMLTMTAASPSPAGPAKGPALDTLPIAAKQQAIGPCPAGQFNYDFSAATTRHGGTPSASVVHADPAGDNAGGNADLTRVAVDRYSASVPTNYDYVTDATNSTPAARAIDPSDLSIDFASATDTSTVTYVWSSTWSRTTGRTTPNAIVRTEPAGTGKVRVSVYPGLATTAIAAGDTKRCLAKTSPSPGSSADYSYVVPLTTTDDGDHRVQIPLDDLLNSQQGPYTGAGTAQFRFHTVSDPGQLGSFGPVDHAPLFAGYSATGTAGAAGCVTSGGEAGVEVYLDRSFTVGATQPVVELNASTTTPSRGSQVTFDLGNTGAGTRLCSFATAFTPNDCSTPNLTQTYQQDATAYLSLDTAAGPWDATQLDIKVTNNRPVAAINRVGTTPAAGTDGSFAIVQGAAVSIPLKVTATDPDSSSFTYRWTLDNGSAPVSTADTYTPSFTTPGTYTVRAYVKDDSGDVATNESVAAVQTITLVRSPQGAVDIVRPARVVNGQPFDIEAETTTGTTGYQSLSWQWDLDGDATTNFDTTHTSRQLTGIVIPAANPSFLVRVRATDAGGRVADATIQLNVRRANETPPVAKFTFTPAAPKSATSVAFDGSTSQLSDPDGALQGPVGASPANVKFHWNFGDGTPEVVTTTATTTHTYAGSGKPDATLVVEDLRAAPSSSSDPVVHAITVTSGTTDANAPVARLVRQDPAPADPVFANRPVTLTASTSTAAAGHAPLSYAFDLDGNGTYEKANATEPTLTFTPATTGALAVGVKITDALGATATTSIALDIKPEPVAKPTVALTGPAELSLTGVSVIGTYDATGSKGNNLDPSVTYRWDLDGNGSFETSTGAAPKVTTTFTSPGPKTVSVRVTDRYGNTADASKATLVRSPADIANGCTGAATFREVTYSNIRLRGCVSSVRRPSAGDLFVISGQAIGFNGMRLAPATGTRPTPRPFADCASTDCLALQAGFNGASAPWAIVLDTGDGTLRSNAATSLRATGSGIELPLLSGPLNVSLPSLASDGFTLGTPPGAELGDFPLAGGVTLKFPAAGETTITVIVGLPAVLGGFTGQATIRVTPASGVVLDALKVDVGEVALGKLTFGDLSFTYDRPDDLWEGGAALTLPSPKPLTIAADLAIQHNRFKSIKAEVSGLNQPIAQAIYLQAIRAGIAVDPLDLTAGITLSAGPLVKKKKVISLDGDLHLRFPSAAANYYLFALTGKLKLADFQLGSAFAQFSSNGFFEMGGGLDARFGIGYATAYVKGWLTADAFNVDADASAGVTIGGSDIDLASGHVTISTAGFGACGEIPIIDVGGGFGLRWGSGVDVFWGCDLSPYRATRPADAPATLGAGARALAVAGAPASLGASALDVRTNLRRGRRLLASPHGHLLEIPANQEKAVMTVTGTTAPPRVSIVDKTGKVLLSTPADGSEVLTKEMLVKADAAQRTTTILWKAPPTGKAWVLEQAGSSPVSKVDLALPAPKRTLGVTVGGSGTSRTLNWNIQPALQTGETVSFAEEGADAGAQITTTAQSTGSVPFTPQGGKAGSRAIMATLSADGLPSTKLRAATYTAPPPPAPARAASLTLRRSSSGVLAHWAPGTSGEQPTKWRLLVRVAHTQRKQLLVASSTARSLRIPNINPGDAVTVSLTGTDAAGIEGPAREAIVRAGLRASSGPLASAATAVPRDVEVHRLGNGKLRVTWSSLAFVHGWSIRVSKAINGQRTGRVTLLRTSGEDHSVDIAGAPGGEVRVSVIGRRFQGTQTRKDVVYLGGTLARK